mgnify:CR=1 FL=1
MTLRIHNIMYDHSQEYRTYPAGVLSVDTLTRAIHVHDGLTPNGWVQPTVSDLSDYALKDLTNVTQESMNNALNIFGAMNMNNADQLSETQRDNVWTKLFGPAMKSDAELPEKNYLYVDPKDRKMKAKNLVDSLPGFGIDTSSAQARANNVAYMATRNCYVTIRASLTAAGKHSQFIYEGKMSINNVEVANMHIQGNVLDFIRLVVPVAKGQRYVCSKCSEIYEYGLLPLS